MKHVVLIVCAIAAAGCATVATDPTSKPAVDASFFNGKDIKDWTGNKHYFSVKDGAIVAASAKRVPKNEFLFSPVKVKDFYLSVRVKQTPFGANSGIQIRSRADSKGHAIGYQADIGKGWWGKLYHEHSGRHLLDGTREGLKHVKREDWNHYEILCVGHRIWSAINGHLSTSLNDPKGELEGYIALQLHSGPAQTIIFKDLRLIHDPEVKLAGLNEAQLNARLRTTTK
jgi:hypothetical protein